jgi:hypothetical protein
MEKRSAASPAKCVSRVGAKARTPSARLRALRPRQPPVALKPATPEALYRAIGLERVQLIREGVPAERIESLVRRMNIPKERLYATLHLPRSTVERKIRNKDTLCPRALGTRDRPGAAHRPSRGDGGTVGRCTRVLLQTTSLTTSPVPLQSQPVADGIGRDSRSCTAPIRRRSPSWRRWCI